MIVLITGASSGIGLETARQLMHKGVRVYACSRRGGIAEKAENDGEIIPVKMVKQILRKRMKLTIVPGLQYKLICTAFNIIPTRLSLWIVEKMY